MFLFEPESYEGERQKPRGSDRKKSASADLLKVNPDGGIINGARKTLTCFLAAREICPGLLRQLYRRFL